MDYQTTIDWLFGQLPMYQNQGKTAYKKDLSNTITLANYLGNPQQRFKTIHVGGTNGKGSTSHILASVLQEAGYKVGLYTSPHLKDFRERIKINGQPISKQFVMGFVRKHKAFFEARSLSFFEMTVGMAFDYFLKTKVDVAIIEVGLGGRLDSTNIIRPELSVITNIGYDHMQFLGDTLPKIATEKAGIIKSETPVVIGETQAEVAEVFKDTAATKKAPIVFADQINKEGNYVSDLKGLYQQRNIQTALAAIAELNKLGYGVEQNHIQRGLLQVARNTGLKGRWQVLGQQPTIVCDTAHNKEGLSYIVEQLQGETYDTLHMVFGVVNDKDLDRIIPILPKQAKYYFCKPKIERGLDADELKAAFLSHGMEGASYSSSYEALKAAVFAATERDFVYVGGSTFVVAEII